jgi:hypothetical protein
VRFYGVINVFFWCWGGWKRQVKVGGVCVRECVRESVGGSRKVRTE